MYVQLRKAGKYEYVYIVEAYRKKDGKIAHRTIEKVGRFDKLKELNPNFLEELKESVKQQSAYLKTNLQHSTMQNFLKGAKVVSDSDPFSTGVLGFPIFYYANAILRHIWKDILKIDYRLNYIQKYYHPDFKINISSLLFHRITERIIIKNLKASDTTLYFVGDVYNPFNELVEYRKLTNFLNDETTDIIAFIVEKLSDIPEVSWIKTFKDFNHEKNLADTLKAVLTANPIHNLNTKEINLLVNQISKKQVKIPLELLESLLCKLILDIIHAKLKENDISATIEEIKMALSDAQLIPCICGSNQILYIKPANKNTGLLNCILQAFNLKPLLNCQVRAELSRRLKMRFNSDEDILTLEVIETYSKNEF